MTDLRRTFELHVDAFRETYGMPTAAALLVDAAFIAVGVYMWFNFADPLNYFGAFIGGSIVLLRAIRLYSEVRA